MSTLADQHSPPTAVIGVGGEEQATASEALTRAVRRKEQRQTQIAQTFANIVAILMRDPGFKSLKTASTSSRYPRRRLAGKLGRGPSPALRIHQNPLPHGVPGPWP